LWNTEKHCFVVAPAYCAQFGHNAVSCFGDPDRAIFILAPQDGQSRTVGRAIRRLTFSTTTGFVRAWLKLIRGSKLCFAILSSCGRSILIGITLKFKIDQSGKS
jgi:hypothetical protein